MNTLDELVYYCQEPEPVGALLLTGEWGCGKTYLIEHELKKELQNKAIVVRISLFGVSSVGEMRALVKQVWMNEYFKFKKIDTVASKAKKGKDVIANLVFIPSWIMETISIDWEMFVEVKEKIGDKPVILVFDDLERCRIDNVDVLGAINDYCENQKFYTIIIANQDKMQTTYDNVHIDVKVNYDDEKNSTNDKTRQKSASLKINMPPKNEAGKISYSEIKEKIIQRTVKYVPDYAVIVHKVIEEMKYEEEEYEVFIKECEVGLLELFAPDRDLLGDNTVAFNIEDAGEAYRNQASNTNKGKYCERPHNIRSLKCAICDFYRVYKILKENSFQDLDKWLYSFISYVISYKADIAKSDVDAYGTILSDQQVRELYPAFQNQYIFMGVKEWILYGIWNEEAIKYEIATIKEQEKAETPTDIVRTNRIIDIDEEEINEGFPGVLDMAYSGNLTLDEYVQFISNSRWARVYDFSLPIPIEWDKVQEGIRTCVKKLIEIQSEGQQLRSFFGDENREHFSEEEWNTYQIINDLEEENLLMFCKNRIMYIEGMKKDAFSTFVVCQNKGFNIFDEEMAYATANAFKEGNNADKCRFPGYFEGLWRGYLSSYYFKSKESITGFNMLLNLLREQSKSLQGMNKEITIKHTEVFIEIVLKLIEKAKEKI